MPSSARSPAVSSIAARSSPNLDGAYIYGDYSTGRIWAMKHDGSGPFGTASWPTRRCMIAGFARRPTANVLVTTTAGGFYRLVPTPVRNKPRAPVPALAQRDRPVRSPPSIAPRPALIPYSVNVRAGPTAHGGRSSPCPERNPSGIPRPATGTFPTARPWCKRFLWSASRQAGDALAHRNSAAVAATKRMGRLLLSLERRTDRRHARA